MIGDLKKMLKGRARQNGMLVVVIVIVLFFQIVTKGIILRPMNIANLVMQNAYVIILATGMMCCILTGGNVDLSVGSLCAFSGAVCGFLMIGQQMNTWLVLAIVFGIAILIGLWNGGSIARFAVPPYIATLASQLIFRGGTYIVLQGVSYTSYPEEFLMLTTGFIPDFFHGNGLHITTLLIGAVACVICIVLDVKKRNRKKKYKLEVPGTSFFIVKQVLVSAAIMWFTYSLAAYKGMPVVLITVALIVLIYNFILEKTVMGRKLYAVCGNRNAARLSGINDNMVLFVVYMNMSILAAIAGIVFTARMNSCSTMIGNGFEGDAIAACFIGGASPATGTGTILGALIGALVIGVLNNGMSILGIQSDVQMCVKGLVLMIAVVFDQMQRKNK